MHKSYRKFAITALGLTLMVSALAVTSISRAQTAKIALTPCKLDIGLGDAKQQIDAQCGKLSVPEDWTKPDGKKLDIMFKVLPAAKQEGKLLPIFHLEGGPGASAIQNFGITWYSSYRGLMQDHDIVLIDQRGMGTSASLQCTESSVHNLTDLAKNLTPADTQKLAVDRMGACLKRLSATTDPANYSSKSLADDTDAIRAALGYDQIDVFGNSYGTWLGQIYLARHGQNVHAIVLDSVVGPWNFASLDFANNAEASLNKTIDLCQQDAKCNTTYPNLRDKLKSALDNLQAKPASVVGNSSMNANVYPVVMTRSRLIDGLRDMQYQGSLIGSMPQAIEQAAKGTYTYPASTLVAEYEILDLSVGSYFSIECAESTAFYTDALIKQFGHSSYFGADDTAPQDEQAICKAWRSAELAPADVAPVKSDRPVLILSGAFDPITPVSYGQEANKRLTHSTLAVFPYEAHGPTGDSKCAQQLIATFFKNPDQPLDTSCTAKDVKPLFAGAYDVNLVSYSDPGGKFQASIPDGWTVEPNVAASPITFFTSPDHNQLLGLGIMKGATVDQAQQQVVAAITAKYGRFDLQAKLTTLGTSIIIHALDTPDEIYSGTLVLLPINGGVRVFWEAAPANIFTATFSAIAPKVLITLR